MRRSLGLAERFVRSAPSTVSTPSHPLSSRRFQPSAIGLGVAMAIASGAIQAQQAPAQSGTGNTLGAVDVIDFRGTQVDSIKYTRDLKDTPRIITILPDDLLQEQNTTN